MFGSLKALPADPILGLLAKYKKDNNPNKIDLGVGVFKNEAGHTAVLDCVKKAEQHRTNTEDSKVYIGPTGSPVFNDEMAKLIFGSDRLKRRHKSLDAKNRTCILGREQYFHFNAFGLSACYVHRFSILHDIQRAKPFITEQTLPL